MGHGDRPKWPFDRTTARAVFPTSTQQTRWPAEQAINWPVLLLDPNLKPDE